MSKYNSSGFAQSTESTEMELLQIYLLILPGAVVESPTARIVYLPLGCCTLD